MKRTFALAVVFLAASALAVPTTIPFTGRLSNQSGPLTGRANVTFRLFDAESGGTELWSETHASVAAVSGLVFVELGAQTSLDAAVFNGQPRWLELTVNSETLAPRIKLASVPYAIRSDTADHLGALAEPDVQRRVTGTCGPSAAINSIDQRGLVQCTASSGVAAGNGIAVSGSTVSLSSAGCGVGSVWKYDGAQFACVADQVGPAYTAGPGISVAGTTVSLSTSGCVSGEVLHFNGAGWDCVPDAVTTDATVLNTGTLSTNLYSAHADLSAEGYFGNNASTDLLNRAECDARYVALAGGTMTGPLQVGGAVTAAGFNFSAPRSEVLSLPAYAVVGEGWFFHVGFAEVLPATVATPTWGAIPLHLPHGVTVTSLNCVFRDTDTTGRISAELRRITSSSDDLLGVVDTTDAATTTGWQTFTDSTITLPVIDNVNSSYYLSLYARNTNAMVYVGLRRCWLTFNTTSFAH